MNLNLWAYHSFEVLLCDIKLAVYSWQLRRYDAKLARLEAMK